jgi:uncharacterized membrane protein YebE (DUF533 family)
MNDLCLIGIFGVVGLLIVALVSAARLSGNISEDERRQEDKP